MLKKVKEYLAGSGLPIIRAATLKEAADRAVSAWKADQTYNY